MPFLWYEEVNAAEPLTQGDVIPDCPVVKFSEAVVINGGEPRSLPAELEAQDCIVMSQACDLEHGKVREVILCPAYPLSEYEPVWQAEMQNRGQNASRKSWTRHLEEIKDGKLWNLSMVDQRVLESGIGTEVRIIDFHEIFSLPRAFLESWIARAGSPRLRLLPPYREHLSQAFARYFMRVGPPLEISGRW